MSIDFCFTLIVGLIISIIILILMGKGGDKE